MSQFLICKSKEDLSKYGIRLSKNDINAGLFYDVVRMYFNSDDNLWVIDEIHDMVDHLSQNIDRIRDIMSKSQEMVFWYASDYKDLDIFYSGEELMDYLYEQIDNPWVEIYLFVYVQ